jgi:putative PIN family toxin of toxin-antitoxin system
MRIMMDTNVLISIVLFPTPQMNKMMEHIFQKHNLVLSSFVVEEFKGVMARKFPTEVKNVDRFLSRVSYELVYTPDEIDQSIFRIRDTHDYPVLYTAIIDDVDVLITGDKDFASVEIDRPEVLTPVNFIKMYMK